MAPRSPDKSEMLRRLAAELRQRQNSAPEGEKPSAINDEDILRAMLGKPLGRRGVGTDRNGKPR